jgi:hypothetical protein
LENKILVTSHVARDFLQNSAYFNTLEKVVWEYVSNSIDNACSDIPPYIDVQIFQDQLSISDNGVGMSRTDLRRFFQMHGENVKRKKGKTVRGKFGTGKTAAFGIGSELCIKTFNSSRINSVLLSLDDIKNAINGEPFPVKILIDNEASSENSGTIITVSKFHSIRTLKIERTIKYIEKQLSRMRIKAVVLINGHKCQYKEPPSTHTWDVKPPANVRDRVGNITMILKAAPAPLPKEDVGVDILANGIWHETTLAEVNGDQVNRIFGYVDVPTLEDDSTYKITAFDNTRNGMLNRSHPVVTALLYWIQIEIKKAQKILQIEAEKHRKTEEAKSLKKKANDIAKMLNADFIEVLDELDQLRQIAGRQRRPVKEGTTKEVILPGEGNKDSHLQQTGAEYSDGHRGNTSPGIGDQERTGPGLQNGKSKGSEGSVSSGSGRRRSQGIFSIEFVNETDNERRSRYDHDNRTIYINLDHPQIDLVLDMSGSTNSPAFYQFVFEVACVEYSQALQFERVNSGEIFDAADAVFSIGEVLDRVTRRIQRA